MARNIVQVAAMSGLVYDDMQKRERHITLPSTVVLCDDGTLWRMQHTIGLEPVKWERYMDVPQND
jgi:hypothetical protein